MNKYLLLRDNKQSGPYTVPEIIAQGIKPYDLVWLEGKSAAWRYPSEIEELKAYAPAVEEQPFDRFYKKPEKTPVAPAEQQQEATTATEEYKKFEPKESVPVAITEKSAAKVYINFPGNKQQTETFIRKSAVAITPEKAGDFQEPPPVPTQLATNLGPANVENRQLYARQEFAAYNTKDRKLLYGVIAACFFLVMFIGIMLVNYNRQRQNIDQLNSIVQQMENDGNQQAAMTLPLQEPAPVDLKEEPPVATTAEISEAPPQSIATKKSPPTPKPATTSAVVFKELTPVNEHHAPAEETEKQQVAAPANLYELISVTPNQYKTGVLGGISNLQFELTNNSNVPLHRVALEVRYLGPEKKVVKKQTVYFESVAAGAQTTINVPKSNRGVSIEYTITDVKSQAAD